MCGSTSFLTIAFYRSELYQYLGAYRSILFTNSLSRMIRIRQLLASISVAISLVVLLALVAGISGLQGCKGVNEAASTLNDRPSAGYPSGSTFVRGDDATLGDSAYVPYTSTIRVMQAGASDVVVLRDTEPGLYHLTRFNAALDTVWNTRLLVSRDRKETPLSVFATTNTVVVLTTLQPVAGADSILVQGRVYDLATGASRIEMTIAQERGMRFEKGVSDFSVAVSPDKSKILLYLIDSTTAPPAQKVALDARLFTADLEFMGVKWIELERGPKDKGSLCPMPLGLAIDNGGLVHLLSCRERSTLEAVRYDFRSGKSRALKTSVRGVNFASRDSLPQIAGMRIMGDGRFDVEGMRIEDGEPRGLFIARFDFNRDKATELASVDLVGARAGSMALADSNRRMQPRGTLMAVPSGIRLFLFENAEHYTDGSSIPSGIDVENLSGSARKLTDSTPVVYNYRDIVIFAIDSSGRPLWQKTLSRNYKETSFSNAQLDVPLHFDIMPRSLDLFYISRKNTGLVRSRVPLDAGAIEPLSLLLWLGQGAHVLMEEALRLSESEMVVVTLTREGPRSAMLRRMTLVGG